MMVNPSTITNTIGEITPTCHTPFTPLNFSDT